MEFICVKHSNILDNVCNFIVLIRSNTDTQRVEHGKLLIPSLFPQDMHINENTIINN